MLAAEALLELGAAQGTLAVGVVLDLGRLEHLPEGDAHSLGDGSGVADDGHSSSINGRLRQAQDQDEGVISIRIREMGLLPTATSAVRACRREYPTLSR